MTCVGMLETKRVTPSVRGDASAGCGSVWAVPATLGSTMTLDRDGGMASSCAVGVAVKADADIGAAAVATCVDEAVVGNGGGGSMMDTGETEFETSELPLPIDCTRTTFAFPTLALTLDGVREPAEACASEQRRDDDVDAAPDDDDEREDDHEPLDADSKSATIGRGKSWSTQG